MNNRTTARLVQLIAVLLAALALRQLWNDNLHSGIALGLFSRRAAYVMALVLVIGLADVLLLALSAWGRAHRLAGGLQSALGRLPRWLRLGGFALGALAVPLLICSGQVDASLSGRWVRAWSLWMAVRLGAVLLQAAWRKDAFFPAVLGGGLLYGVVVQLATYLPQITATPFSLGWSEASRFYNASLFAARQVYGFSLPLPALHPTRYLLQAAAFLIPDAPILLHRVWQVLLWAACNGFTAWALARRLRLPRWQGVLAGAWAYLFFFEGPVYYHLVVCAGMVLLGFDRARPLRSLVVVLTASLWAGLSRINWYPVPGVLAVVLYLLEQPRGSTSLWRYLLWPALWAAAGTALAFAANAAYIAVSGNPPEVFGSALSSPLLWYRLFPNITYPQGIVPASLYAFLPAVVLGVLRLVLSGARWNWLRWLGLAGVLAVFYAAGLVVSVKVGGGGNLHNLDNFIVLLAVAALYAWFNRFAADRPAPRERPSALLNAALLVVALLPVLQPLSVLAPPLKLKSTPAEESALLSVVQKMLNDAQGKGPVLFISERQLLTFKNLEAQQFEAEYEKVFLMEMAMAGNPQYLGLFSQQLAEQRFPLIISEPLNANIQDQTRAFSEENNLWVTRVEQPILQYYRLLDGFDAINLYVYVPK